MILQVKEVVIADNYVREKCKGSYVLHNTWIRDDDFMCSIKHVVVSFYISSSLTRGPQGTKKRFGSGSVLPSYRTSWREHPN